MRLVLIIFLLVFELIAISFNPEEVFPLFKDNDLNQLQIVETNYFYGNGLYGYLNGESELFQEYGFEALAVQEINLEEHDVVVEIYRMKSPMDAFGIFSVSREKFTIADSSNFLSAFCKDKVLMAYGQYFIIISKQSDIKEFNMVIGKMIAVLKNRIGENTFKIPNALNQSIVLNRIFKLKMIKGPVGVANYLPEWSARMDKLKDYEIYTLILDDKNPGFKLNILNLKSGDVINNFLLNNQIEITGENIWKIVRADTGYIALKRDLNGYLFWVEVPSQVVAFQDILANLN